MCHFFSLILSLFFLPDLVFGIPGDCRPAFERGRLCRHPGRGCRKWGPGRRRGGGGRGGARTHDRWRHQQIIFQFQSQHLEERWEEGRRSAKDNNIFRLPDSIAPNLFRKIIFHWLSVGLSFSGSRKRGTKVLPPPEIDLSALPYTPYMLWARKRRQDLLRWVHLLFVAKRNKLNLSQNSARNPQIHHKKVGFV